MCIRFGHLLIHHLSPFYSSFKDPKAPVVENSCFNPGVYTFGTYLNPAILKTSYFFFLNYCKLHCYPKVKQQTQNPSFRTQKSIVSTPKKGI